MIPPPELLEPAMMHANPTPKFHATLPNLADLTLIQIASPFASQLSPGKLGSEMIFEHLIEVKSTNLKT